MNKINTIKVVKVVSMVASVAGMIGSAWAGSRENESVLKKLVEERLQK